MNPTTSGATAELAGLEREANCHTSGRGAAFANAANTHGASFCEVGAGDCGSSPWVALSIPWHGFSAIKNPLPPPGMKPTGMSARSTSAPSRTAQNSGFDE